MADWRRDVTGPALILDAAAVAARAHSGQVRKGTSGAPYIEHPLAVARLVADHTDDPEVLAAALLHDVLEDSAITRDDLARDFGDRITDLVAELTDDPSLEAMDLPRRKARQAEHVAGVSGQAQAIKIADQTSNLRDLASDPSFWDADRHAAYREGAVRIVAACRSAAPGLAAAFDAAARNHERATGA